MKKDRMTNILLAGMLVLGLSLLLYPSFCNWRNDRYQRKAIAGYSDWVDSLDEEAYASLWNAAIVYNQSLLEGGNPHLLTGEQKQRYRQMLNGAGNGILAVLHIPSIEVTLPVCHGTGDAVLQTAIGHIEWSSLPTGGKSTHCVVSGHRGLPTARLFTDLDKLTVGDCFLLNTLDQVLTYEVDQILVVEPEDTRELLIQEEKDLVTLVTCTPYGINSHRLLVRGHRTGGLR